MSARYMYFYRPTGNNTWRAIKNVLPFSIWAASSEFGTYQLCEQRRFRRACASTQFCQNLRYSLIQAVSQEEPSDRKPDPYPLWMAGHAQLKFVMTECSKTQIRLTGLILFDILLYADLFNVLIIDVFVCSFVLRYCMNCLPLHYILMIYLEIS